MQTDRPTIRFGRFRLFPAARQLLCDNQPVRLGGRAFDLLLYLTDHPGVVVTKDALMSAVWPERVVEENNLTVHMTALRRALGDQSIIRTIPGRGYAFTMDVVVEEDGNQPVAREPAPAAPAEAAPRGDFAALPPPPPVRLIGRDDAMAELRRLAEAARLITLVGPGGVGKTSMALQLAADLAPAFQDGVVFVDLSVLADPTRVAEAVAAALGGGAGSNSAVERLTVSLRDRTLLLLLDNCEHVIEPVARLVTGILSAAQRVLILATSREGLFLNQERIFRVLPLPVPSDPARADRSVAMDSDAVRLFVERAEAVGPFALTDETAPLVATICARLDGIPLAIEMAAARLRILSPGQLADRLDERFRLLGATQRGTTARHRTLRAVIDWSYDLLPDAERALLRALSVFTGGADLPAIQAVAVPHDDDDLALLDQLTGLADKSLVSVDMAGGSRFRLLETVRQYAVEKRQEAGEGVLSARHALYFADLFTVAADRWPTTPGPAWLDAYAAEADNLRTALTWAFGSEGDTATALRLAAATVPLWWELPDTPVAEGQRWLGIAAARLLPDTPAEIRGWIRFGQSWRDFRFGDLQNLAAAQDAIALFREAGTRSGLGAALWRAGSAQLTSETADAAERCLIEAEAVLRRLPPGKWLALALVRLADLRFRKGELSAAFTGYQEGVALSRSIECWIGLINGGSNMAELLYACGDSDAALRQLRELRNEFPPGRRAPLMATLTAHLLLAGATAEMIEVAKEAILQATAIGLASALAWTLEAVALFAAVSGEIDAAAHLEGWARGVHPSVATRAGSRRAVVEKLDELLNGRMGSEQLTAALAAGQNWSATIARERALSVLERHF